MSDRDPSFVLRHALREGRSGVRRIGVYMASITLGVAALVAIHSFRADVERSIDTESRALLGADLRFEQNQPFDERTLEIVDSLDAAGAEVSRVTVLMSMVYAPEQDLTRLLQVYAVEGGFPLYGDVTTSPAGLWEEGHLPGSVLVDPAVRVQLDLDVGDRVLIGSAEFTVAGSAEGLPTDLGFQTAVGPRVYVSAAELERTGLLTYGSLARYRVFLRFDEPGEARTVQRRYTSHLRSQSVDSDTAGELAGNLTEGLDILSRFLSLVGLVALLLGGVGVASAIHVYIKERLDGVAMLRCVGATERDVFLAYLLQTGALGLLGAGVGVLGGLGVQLLLPGLLAGVLPVDVTPTFHPGPAIAGLVAGVWIAGIFALIPLLGLREATPLQALRRDFESESGASASMVAAFRATARESGLGSALAGVDRVKAGAYAALLASVVAVSVWQAPSWEIGLGFSAGLAVSLGLLYLCSLGLMRAVRRYFPRRAAYPLRHGIANLFRPRNQTVTVVLALGFGVFLVSSVGQVRESLLDQFAVTEGEDRPNLLLFDIQADQEAGVVDMLREAGGLDAEITPVIPARLAAVDGRPVDELLQEGRRERPPRWVLSRLYRNTFQEELSESEELVAGAWWGGESEGLPTDGGEEAGPHRISIAADLAEDLEVYVGDRLTWDVQGAIVESRIASIRSVDWSQLRPNFFVVFEPGAIDDAPRTSVALARIADADSRIAVQTRLVRAFPNVSVVDLEEMQAVLDQVLGRVTDAIRFLAGFCMVAGLLVLAGALATSRFQRQREGALLRTIGAGRGQMLKIVLSEYVSLGAVAGGVGVLLGVVGGWMVVRWVFEIPFRLDPMPLVWLWVGMAAVTAVVGVVASSGVVRHPPLVVLRRSAD